MGSKLFWRYWPRSELHPMRRDVLGASALQKPVVLDAHPAQPMNTKKWLGLAGWLLLCYAVSFVASQFQPGPWFDTLAKPSWNPPSWVFGPVWGVLYGLMGLAAWRVWWMAGGFREAGAALGTFLVQLGLNGLWSGLFFGAHAVGWAFVDIVVLWLAILATTILFWRRSTLAGALLLPYLAWVGFAAALNGAIWQLNA